MLNHAHTDLIKIKNKTTTTIKECPKHQSDSINGIPQFNWKPSNGMVAHTQIHKHRPKTTIKCACEPQKPANIPLISWIKMDELLPFANQFIAKAIEHNGKWWLQFSDTVRSLIHSSIAWCMLSTTRRTVLIEFDTIHHHHHLKAKCFYALIINQLKSVACFMSWDQTVQS